jgi:nitrite reductase (NADH) large subunit
MAIALERRLEGLQMPTPLTIAVSGSPMHRAGTLAKDVGIVGVPGGWEIYVGGNAGRSLRQAQLLSIETMDRAALELAAAFLQAYRELAYYGETTWDWIERVGLVALRETLFNRAERAGLIERLDSDGDISLSRSIQRRPAAAWERVN